MRRGAARNLMKRPAASMSPDARGMGGGGILTRRRLLRLFSMMPVAHIKCSSNGIPRPRKRPCRNLAWLGEPSEHRHRIARHRSEISSSIMRRGRGTSSKWRIFLSIALQAVFGARIGSRRRHDFNRGYHSGISYDKRPRSNCGN